MYKTVGCANCGSQKTVDEMNVIYPLENFPAYYVCKSCFEQNYRKELDNLAEAFVKLLCRHHVSSEHDGHYLECREPSCFGARLALTPYKIRPTLLAADKSGLGDADNSSTPAAVCG